MATPLLSEVPFGSYLVYSPRGTSDVSRRSRRVRDAVKRGDTELVKQIVEHLKANFAASGLDCVLGADVTLVPTPRSSPLIEGALWPGRLVADALVAIGLGKQVLRCVERVEAVPKSSFQQPGGRPSARRHYDTMRAQGDLAATQRLTLIDDFLTKGQTLLGAASRLVEAYPGREVAAFALVRTLGRQPEVMEIVAPCTGRVSRVGEDSADRDP